MNVTPVQAALRPAASTSASAVVERIAPTGLLTTEQAADYLAVKPATLSTWRSTNRKKLAYVKVGGQVRYRREDLERFVDANLRNA
jgi:excisionase family DNA binding protein